VIYISLGYRNKSKPSQRARAKESSAKKSPTPETAEMSYGRAPLGATTTVIQTPEGTVRKTCHTDHVQHCQIETMGKQHCDGFCPPKPCPPPPCAPPPAEVCPKPCADPCATSSSGWGGAGALIVWFLVIFAITWLVLWLLKPSWILKTCKNGNGGNGNGNGHDGSGKHHNKEVDTGKIILAAILIALGIVIIIWLIKLVLGWSACCK
jgi:hypothetical protein